ncbi:MAG: MFS transporter [Desulfovibrionaceae bacterium]
MPDSPAHGLPLRRALPALLLIAGVFFLNFLSRVALAPLLPAVEADLGLGHGASGGLFLHIALGNAAGLLLSGLVSARLGHRRTIAATALALGAASCAAAGAGEGLWFRGCLTAMGLAAGVYLPSGVASIMALVRPADWGKAVAVHEMAPNAAFVAAPLLAEAALALAGWRAALLALGLAQAALGLVFLRWGRGSEARGRPLSPRTVAAIAGRGRFWLLAACFCLASAGSFAPFTMLTLYLTDLGRPRPEVNQLLALSRLCALFMPMLAGVLVDRIGARPAAAAAFACNALALAGLSLASGGLLTALVVVQPMTALLFYPAGFTILSRLHGPDTRSAAVALITPLSIVCGVGLAPLLMGVLGEAGHFRAGYGAVAALVAAGALLAPLLRSPKVGAAGAEGGV